MKWKEQTRKARLPAAKVRRRPHKTAQAVADTDIALASSKARAKQVTKKKATKADSKHDKLATASTSAHRLAKTSLIHAQTKNKRGKTRPHSEDDEEDTQMARAVAQRTAAFLRSLSGAQQHKLSRLRAQAEGRETDEPDEAGQVQHTKQKKKSREDSDEEAGSEMSESDTSSEPSWLTESDDSVTDDEEDEEEGEAQQAGQDNDHAKPQPGQLHRGGHLFRGDDALWED